MELTLTRGLLWSLECEMGTTSKGSKDFNSRLNVHHVAIGNSIFRSLGWMNSIVNFISSRLSYYRPYLYITSIFFFAFVFLMQLSWSPPVVPQWTPTSHFENLKRHHQQYWIIHTVRSQEHLRISVGLWLMTSHSNFTSGRKLTKCFVTLSKPFLCVFWGDD